MMKSKMKVVIWHDVLLTDCTVYILCSCVHFTVTFATPFS